MLIGYLFDWNNDFTDLNFRKIINCTLDQKWDVQNDTKIVH